MRRIEGVTASVNETMQALNADTLREDGLLLRTCKVHGVRHPVGHLHRALRLDGDLSDFVQHTRRGDTPPMIARAECCGCCTDWTTQ